MDEQMQQQLEQQRQYCLNLSDRLLAKLKSNDDDAQAFMSGDILKNYVLATEAAVNKTRRLQNKIRNL